MVVAKLEYLILHILIEDPEYGKVRRIAISAVVRYSDFNEPIDITPPLTPFGDLEPEWRLVGSGGAAPKKKPGASK